MEMSPPKRCAVCGDKALGYNFNAVTCESCKAFFRRNALAKKQFTCPFSQNCEITVVTRRFCQRCRLKKCLDIGMKSENIMSEEDKIIKRRKIENNRAKRRLNEEGKVGTVAAAGGDINAFDTASHDSESSYDSGKGTTSNNSANAALNNLASSLCGGNAAVSPNLYDVDAAECKPELMTSEEIVEFIVGDPDRASQAISKLIRTKDDALYIFEKILTSQKDALRLVSHLIAFPGDALKIISKIMNSPFDALTVFTKFMSSPTDALEIITKIISSPQDVVQFIRCLMECPEDALLIMNKFMNTPAEALRIINKIFNKVNPPSDELHKLLTDASNDTKESSFQAAQALPAVEATETGNDILETILDNSPIMAQQMTNEISAPPKNTQQHQQESLFPNSALMVGTHMNISTTATTRSNIGTETPNHQSILQPTVNAPAVSTCLVSSTHAMSLAPPKCVVSDSTQQRDSVQQYNSPVSLHSDIELPSSLSVLINPNSPTNIESACSTSYCNDNFDIKTLIQQAFPDTAINAAERGSLNSLESVLSEVIRIEFEAFSNLPQEPRVKQEQLQFQANSFQMSDMIEQHKKYNYNVCNNPQAQPQQQSVPSPPSNMVKGRDLNEAELSKIRELKLASEALYYPMDLSDLMMGDERIKPEGTNQDPKLLQVINLTAVAIKRLIKMAKKIGAFQDMCQEDQVALLKGGCTEMMIMRSVLSYDNNFNTWKLPHVSNSAHIRADILKQAKGNIYEEILKFVSNFDEKLRTDENIILIMCAIVLFTPTRERVIHSDVIRLEQSSYLYLLRRYLESVYSGCEARSAFIGMIQKISEIAHLNQFVIGVYLNVNPSQVEPLLREMFDLKNH